MPGWVWLFWIVCIAACGFSLWRTYNRKHFSYLGVTYS